MGIIRRGYSKNFYHWPIEEEKKYDSMLKWESVKDQPILVFHPFLSFDPISNFDRQRSMLARDHSNIGWEMSKTYDLLESIFVPEDDKLTPIIHEKIKADFNFFDSSESLLAKIEYNFKVPEDEWLWNDTGYWSAIDSKYGYMGISEDSAFDLWNQSKDLILCYIASNPCTLLEFKLDKREENSFSLNIYYANKFVAFPDLIDAIHRALDEVGCWKTIKIEKKDHDIIFDSKYNNHQLTKKENPTTFSITPTLVMPLGDDPHVGTDLLYAVIVENTFFKIENMMKKPEGYAIVIRGGGWLREDFQAEKKYNVSFTRVRRLENCFLVRLVVNELKEDVSNYTRRIK